MHLAFARAAAERAASLLLFPELSLTGYELNCLASCIVTPDDEALLPLREFSQRARMTLVVGAPVASELGDRPSIGAICLRPNGEASLYRKRFLHPGEEPFAAPGSINVHSISLDRERVCLAICADTVSDEEGNSFYLVQLRTERSHLGSEEEPLLIIPGMIASVDIVTGRKSILSYLLKPIIRARSEAFRER